MCKDDDNDPIKYKIESNSLSIDSTSGLVTLQIALDREVRNKACLILRVYVCVCESNSVCVGVSVWG